MLKVDLVTLSSFSPVVNEKFQLTRSAGSLGVPPGVAFDLDDFLRKFESSRAGGGKSVRFQRSDLPSSNYTMLHSIDDFSNGYLRRSVSASRPAN
jgi:hypothetical protein